MTSLLLSLVLTQTTLGPYFKLGTQDNSALLDGGARMRGALIFATNSDGGVSELDYYDGTFWNAIPASTTAPVTLYVDPTGSDGNACIGTGTSACLTLAGAVGRLPINLLHNVTINVANGTYAEAFNLTRPFNVANGVTLTVAGTMTNVTPATGAATGTVTSSAAGSSAGPPTVTDSAQTWTVNDLKGKFITFTSGALSGNSYPIVSNTATTVTFPNSSTAAVGVTYAIQTPGAVFSSASVSSIYGQVGQGTIQVRNVKMTRTANSVLNVGSLGAAGGTSTYLTFTSVHVEAVSSNGINNFNGRFDVTRSYIRTAGSGFGFNNSSSGGVGSAGGLASSYVSSATGPAYTAPTGGNGPSTSVFEGGTTSSTSPVVSFRNLITTPMQAVGMWVTCTGGAGSIGIGAEAAPSNTLGPGAGYFTSNTQTRVTGCTTGVQIQGRMAATITSPAFDTVTTAFSVTRGGQLTIYGTPVFTTVTNELSLDGAVYPFSFLSSLTPAVISNTYGSTIVK